MNRKPVNFSYHNTNFEDKDDLLEIIYRKGEIDTEVKAAKFYGFAVSSIIGGLDTFKLLAQYATLAFSAMTSRELGLISIALELEEEAEKIYNTLPRFSRW